MNSGGEWGALRGVPFFSRNRLHGKVTSAIVLTRGERGSPLPEGEDDMNKFHRDCRFYQITCFVTVAYLTALCALMLAIAMM